MPPDFWASLAQQSFLVILLFGAIMVILRAWLQDKVYSRSRVQELLAEKDKHHAKIVELLEARNQANIEDRDMWREVGIATSNLAKVFADDLDPNTPPVRRPFQHRGGS